MRRKTQACLGVRCGGELGGSWCVAAGLALLDAAVIAMAVGIFEAQAHLWTIFLQVEELLAVERSATLPGR